MITEAQIDNGDRLICLIFCFHYGREGCNLVKYHAVHMNL